MSVKLNSKSTLAGKLTLAARSNPSTRGTAARSSSRRQSGIGGYGAVRPNLSMKRSTWDYWGMLTPEAAESERG